MAILVSRVSVHTAPPVVVRTAGLVSCSVNLSCICLFILLSTIYLSICVSIVYVSIILCIYLLSIIYLFISQSIYLFIYLVYVCTLTYYCVYMEVKG